MRRSRTSAWLPGAAAAMLLLGLAGAHGADSPAAAVSAQRPLTPMMQDIQALLEQEHATVDALRQRLEQTHDRAEALALQLQVEQAKRQAQWSILEVQIRYAQTAGRTAVVEELQQALAAAKRPPTPITSLERRSDAPPSADSTPAQK